MAAPGSPRAAPTILCVDDDDAARYLLERALVKAGFTVTSASGVSEGLELLRRQRFRLVISDYRMRDGTGTWMLKQAAAGGLLEGTEVLLFTGSTELEGAAGLTVVAKERGTENILAQVLELLGVPESPSSRAPTHAERAMVRIELVLYTAGASPASMRALRQMKSLLAGYVPAQVDFRVVDLAGGRPASAEEDHVLLTPTLVKHSPLPRIWVVGDLEDTTVVTDLLEHSGVERQR